MELGFDLMGLKTPLLRGIYANGLETPNEVQKRAIPLCIKGDDLVCQAQSGTGKTAVFAISVLQLIDTSVEKCQALILAPTHQLVHQVEEDINAFGANMDLHTHTCTGGTKIKKEIKKLEKGRHHVVVGTPGRVLHMIDEGALRTEYINVLVLDEADMFFSKRRKGFLKDIKRIFESLADDVQVLLFSATMPPKVFRWIKEFVPNPKSILVKNEQLTLEGIQQFYVVVESKESKVDTLIDLCENRSTGQAFIFCDERKTVEVLEKRMIQEKIAITGVHAQMDPIERSRIMKDFRAGSIRTLITTDLLGRGIDVQQVSLVINYDFPVQPEKYIHRMGRAGRFGRKGVAISFVTEEDLPKLNKLEAFYSTLILELPKNLEGLI